MSSKTQDGRFHLFCLLQARCRGLQCCHQHPRPRCCYHSVDRNSFMVQEPGISATFFWQVCSGKDPCRCWNTWRPEVLVALPRAKYDTVIQPWEVMLLIGLFLKGLFATHVPNLGGLVELLVQTSTRSWTFHKTASTTILSDIYIVYR